ncbi:unnamed protein product [Cuscuta campestris]|uniref:Retrovirus-related Pol polyprotein from transposon TNT 1-94-like beta-barrel domain-containing protein n=1 Tax=Cuscuta campestris TaxID=132261 RepID=A0A484M1L9_9ASTE|nr:unnamed protein product [Cuscuta campestris]
MSLNCTAACVNESSIRLRTHDGTFCTLNKVRHVPQMTKNLISLTRLDSKGFSFEGKGGVMSVNKDSKVVLKGIKHGTLYLLQGSVIVASEIHRGDESLNVEVEVPSARIETVDHLEKSSVSTPQ